MTTRLEQEYRDQPQVLARFLERELDHVLAIGREIRRSDLDVVIFAARGSSDNVARYGQYVLGIRNGLASGLATPSIFTRYEARPDFNHAVVVAISQSGRSPDIRAVAEHARSQGRPCIVVTNNAESPLAALASHLIDLGAGPERSVAATKTYTASVLSIAALSVGLADDNDSVASEALHEVCAAVADTVDSLVCQPPDITDLAGREHWTVIGRGINYGTAHEIALKIRELAGVVAEAYSPADILHGPIAALRPHDPVLLVAPHGRVETDLREIIAPLRARRAHIIAISDVEGILNEANLTVALPRPVEEWLSPLTTVLPGQHMAMDLAAARGVEVDKPHGLNKVTETR